MVRQVPVLAVLTIVQGSLECLAGVFYAAMGPMMRTILRGVARQQPRGASPVQDLPEGFATGMAAFYVVAGLVVLAVGALRIVAGIRGLKYRSRTLGIVSLAAGLLSVVTCYCLPTSLALAVYGLIVYLNADVGRAFEMGERGASSAEIQAAFP